MVVKMINKHIFLTNGLFIKNDRQEVLLDEKFIFVKVRSNKSV